MRFCDGQPDTNYHVVCRYEPHRAVYISTGGFIWTGQPVSVLLVEIGLAKSRSEAERGMRQGGIHVLECAPSGWKKLKDPSMWIWLCGQRIDEHGSVVKLPEDLCAIAFAKFPATADRGDNNRAHTFIEGIKL